MVKQYIITKALNILIEVLNKSDFTCNNLDEEFIKEEIIDITKIIRKVLFIYLMKIMPNNNSYNNKNRPKIILPPPAPNKSKETYIEPPKAIYDKKEIVVKENFYQFGNVGVSKKKQKLNGPKYQYRWNHFELKNRIIYCFFPKSKTNSSKFFLYYIKRTCNAKFRIDLALKKISLIGYHNDHERVNIDKLRMEHWKTK